MTRRLVWLLLLATVGCGLIPSPLRSLLPTPATPTGTAAVGKTATATFTPAASPPVPIPTGTIGAVHNPVIFSLAPAPRTDPNTLNAGTVLVGQLEKSTLFNFITIAPTSEADLISRFQKNDADIGVLSPFGYLLASANRSAGAAFARGQDGNTFYGAQFIVRSDANYAPFFDTVKNANTADAPTALVQFQARKPCWSDPFSPSGYVVPLGFLAMNGVQTAPPAFVAGQPTVVRAVYAQGICDFGATYIDARTYPGLADAFPDVLTKVIVVWRIPNIIPYDTLVFSNRLDNDTRRALTRAFVDAMNTPTGNAAMQTLYGISAMQVSQDSQYDDFRNAVKASGLDLSSLLQ